MGRKPITTKYYAVELALGRWHVYRQTDIMELFNTANEFVTSENQTYEKLAAWCRRYNSHHIVCDSLEHAIECVAKHSSPGSWSLQQLELMSRG